MLINRNNIILFGSFASIIAGLWALYSFYGQVPKIIINDISFSGGSSNGKLINLSLNINIINNSNKGIYFNKIILLSKIIGRMETTEIYEKYGDKVFILPPMREMELKIVFSDTQKLNDNYSELLKDQTYTIVIDRSFFIFYRPYYSIVGKMPIL